MELHNPVELLNELYQHKKQIEDSIADIKNKLIDAPEGSLRIVKKRKKSYYYHITSKNDTEGNYIQRKDEALAIRLAQKDYDEKLLTALEQQLSTIDRFLKCYDSDAPQKVYEKLTEARKALIEPDFLSDEDFVRKWQNEPYQRLPFYKDEPEFYTARGERVRSKSEILIADALYRHNIPYRYEYPVYNKGVIIAAPDFNYLNVDNYNGN